MMDFSSPPPPSTSSSHSMDFGVSSPSGSSGGGLLQHPFVSFFHVFFRFSALFLYLFGGFFFSSFISLFVLLVLLLSIDFWTVKNITGRIMVGLRWWNYIDDDGQSQWMFEARNGQSQHLLSATEVRLFWFGLILAPAFWVLFFFTAIFNFRFQWLVVVFIGLSLSTSNLLGYLRCRLGKKEGLYSAVSGVANDYMKQQMLANMWAMVTRRSGGGAGAGDAATNMASTPQNVI